MGIRRVVTGHDASGKAVFASDTNVEPITLALLPERSSIDCGGQINRVASPTMARRLPTIPISHQSVGFASDCSRLHPTHH